ncbi:MAG: tRNA (guanosine(37)-N1)-methyltransferase TrmD [Fusobacteria bacterium]|nr:tRNA (guanosine(37)-N1)-methyltransferase TrmD [Fusobacteriota bacterium]
MKINILTLFPEMFSGFLGNSIIKRAIESLKIEINTVNIRDYTKDKHKTADDYPYGGGAGMVLKVEPILEALNSIDKGFVIYTSPQGKTLNQNLSKYLSEKEIITIIAGHYEGIDERVVESSVDMEISIGDYVLTGGELASMVIIDSVVRLVNGVLGNKDSYIDDSFYNGLLDYPQYTRPENHNEMKVPEVLLSGNHENIRKWRLRQSIERTYKKRPDLLLERKLSKEEEKILDDIKKGELK